MRERQNMNDLKKYKLKGNIKDLKYVEYEPLYLNDSTSILKIDDFLGMTNNISTFNKLGYLEKKIELRADFGDSLSTSAIWTYNYDKENKIIREFRESKENRDTISWNYTYPQKNTTLIKQYDKTYHVLYYKYVQENNVELLTTANSDSSYQRKMKFIYDDDNRLIQYENYEDTDSIVNLRVLNYKDKSRNFSGESTQDKKYKFKNKQSYEYDDNGNMIKVFDEESKLIRFFEYVYDNRKNWIELKSYNSNGKLYSVYKREISYY